jgi:glycerate 2-kinase
MVSGTPKTHLHQIFEAALAAVDPYQAVCRYTESLRNQYEKEKFKKLFVLGFGKAVTPMVQAIVDEMGDLITGGLGVTKYGHGADAIGPIKIYQAGHPLPDEAGVRATEKLIELIRDFNEHTLGICLISGGGSALLVAPFPGIMLSEKIQTTDLLLMAGADINDLNTVRKHLSRVKGGRLAEMVFPGALRSFIVSDVIGDKLDVIASGPTAPDGTTYGDALQVLKKYGIVEQLPPSVFNVLSKGVAGEIPETPKDGGPFFSRAENTIVASNKSALEAAGKKAKELGYETVVLSHDLKGEAREVGRWLAEKALEIQKGSGPRRRICLLSGGETTVTVKGEGKGGRNMELALAFALEAAQTRGVTLLSGGTDGTDGPTDADGALADGQTIAKARALELEAKPYLDNNDSYHFFEKTKDLLITGPTQTNVMDLQIILVES